MSPTFGPLIGAVGSASDQMSTWFLVGAGMVGFALAWLVFELRRAWSPEALRDAARATPFSTSERSSDDESVRQILPLLVEQVAQLRDEVGALRESSRPNARPATDEPTMTSTPLSNTENVAGIDTPVSRTETALSEFQRIRAEQRDAQRAFARSRTTRNS
jgi:hypothetical protein